MNGKGMLIVFVTVGSFVGGYVPSLMGKGDNLSLSILTGAIGGIIGLWLGWRFVNSMEE